MTTKTWTIGQLARRFALARSTLLYYDKTGLLPPSGRTGSNYRLYTDGDFERLERIRHYRAAGLSLEAIAQILDTAGRGPRAVLEQRLRAINQEIQQLRSQQALILELLKTEELGSGSLVVTKAMWVAMLRAAGLDEAGMCRWHCEFERLAPEAHQDLLASLGIPPQEIEAIRAWSVAGDHAVSA